MASVRKNYFKANFYILLQKIELNQAINNRNTKN